VGVWGISKLISRRGGKMGVFNFKKKMGWILCLVTVTVLYGGLSAHALMGDKINEYTANQVMIDPDGKVEHEGKIYMTPDKMRMDGIAPTGDGSIILIFRRDKNIGWTLNPEKKLYMERPLNEKEMEQSTKKFRDSRNEKVLGTETVNGFKCTKKEIETTIKGIYGFKKTVKTIVWVSNRLDMPIRTKSEDGSMTELRKIKEGTPASKYFEIPKGYKKVANVIELMDMDMSELEEKPSKPAGEDKPSSSPLPFKLPKKITDLLGN
jgi:hypothetical protein